MCSYEVYYNVFVRGLQVYKLRDSKYMRFRTAYYEGRAKSSVTNRLP